MRIPTLLLASLLAAGAAQAQTAPSPLTGSVGTPNGPAVSPGSGTNPAATTAAPASPAPATSAPTSHRRRTLAERFDAANTTHDGHLTLAQARAGHMNAVARDFAKIDKDSKGYVTIDDIRTYQKERRAARRAARTNQAQ